MVNIPDPEWKRYPDRYQDDDYAAPETLECSICGAEISEEQSAYNMCAKCESKALARFKVFLTVAFDDNEREFLDTCIEGIGITDPAKLKPVLA